MKSTFHSSGRLVYKPQKGREGLPGTPGRKGTRPGKTVVKVRDRLWFEKERDQGP